jgi:hypothetical protein
MSDYGGSIGLAFGISTTFKDGHTSARLSVATSTKGGPVHISGGAGFSF